MELLFKKRIYIGIILILFIGLIYLTIVAFLPNEENKSSMVNVTNTKDDDMCTAFTKINSEVSCEEAVGIALEQAPGKIISADIKSEKPPNFSGDINKLPKFWEITIKPDIPNTKNKNLYILKINAATGNIEDSELK